MHVYMYAYLVSHVLIKLIIICMGVDTGGALGAEAPPDFQALQYIPYTCMEIIVEF